jgi:hypothetical protein
MSRLALALVAVLVMGDAPEEVSTETEEVRALDLSGEWQGTFRFATRCSNARYAHGMLTIDGRKLLIRWVDLGHCRLQLQGPTVREDWHGTYRQEEDRVTILFKIGNPPESKQEGVVTLCRVKTRK